MYLVLHIILLHNKTLNKAQCGYNKVACRLLSLCAASLPFCFVVFVILYLVQYSISLFLLNI